MGHSRWGGRHDDRSARRRRGTSPSSRSWPGLAPASGDGGRRDGSTRRARGPEDLAALRSACAELGLTIDELWIRYVGIGGNRSARCLAAYLAGDIAEMGRIDHDHIVAALNDCYHDRTGRQPLPYIAT